MLRFILIFAAFLSISTVNAQATYCTPSFTHGCGSGDQISDFYTIGGITDISNTSSGCSSGNYSYNNTQPLTVNPGGSFTIRVKSGPTWAQGQAIWVDWNNDLDFDDAGEHMWTSAITSTTLQTVTLATPAAQAQGTFRMRVRCNFGSLPTDPCASQTFGEVEDYDIIVEQSNQVIHICNGEIPAPFNNVDSVTGGSGNYTYVWQSSVDFGDNWVTAAGNYDSINYVPVTSLLDTVFYQRMVIDQSCGDSAYSNMIEVHVPDSLMANPTVSNLSCNGNMDGSITTTANGGFAPYAYLWSNGDTTSSITGLVASTYSVTITDNNGCISTSTVTVTEPAMLVAASVVDSNITCNSLSDGGASASSTGGTMPYTYAWSNAATTASITGVMAGTYSVTITDANGCTSTSSATVTEPTILVSASIVDSNITCNGLSEGGATASSTGGTMPYSYAWSNAATTASITGVMAGTYSVTIIDANGCTDSSSAIITEPATLFAASVTDSNNTCNGLSEGGATASSTGGTVPYTYAWSNAATTASITGVMAGTYSVTITDANGCTDSTSTMISEPVMLVATSVVDSNITCNGLSDGGATASSTGGTMPYTYSWSNSATTASITGVVAGTYTATMTDAKGCTSISSATVTQPVILVAATVVDSNISCNSLSDGGASTSATGGTTPYTYAWSNAATTASITGVMAGTYSVTVTDANGCTSISSATVTEPTILVSASVTDSNNTCNGLSEGGATASSTGGTVPYTYAWSNAATTASITGVMAGTYSVTITDANGCTDSTSTMISEPVMLVATSVVDSNITCNGLSDGGASTSATGGTTPYTYAWSNSATTASITGVMAGTYSVTVTDANGCTSISSATVTEPTILVSASVVDSNITCNGLSDGGATTSATGGTMPYTYSWSNSATTASITGVIAGTYSVTITDANGCTDSSSILISEPAMLVSASMVDSNTSCNGFADGGATASATGGTSAYTYAWSNVATTASITGIVAGTYTATITDANGCTSTSSVSVVEPTILVASSVVDSNITCNGLSDGGATASSTGGTMPYTYAWSNSATTASITGVMAGTYSVTVTDQNGCSDSSSVIVTEPTLIVVSTTVDSNISCNGLADGGATVSATGGTMPYTYSWSNSATTASITGVIAGTYSVTITDANGCTSTSSVSVVEPTILVASSAVDSNITCNGLSDGGATASSTGGTMPYTYSWSNSATTAAITGIIAGTYSVTITDANGCTSTSSVSVVEPALLVVSSVVDSNTTCNGASDGGATASVMGGTGMYTYTWSNSATTASITGVVAGTYTVTVMDANGCIANSASTVTEPDILVTSIAVDSNETCMNTMDGGLSASATGGTTPYTYAWSNLATTDTISGLTASMYTVTITDANGCSNVASETIVHGLATSSTVTVSSCDSYTSPSGNNTWMSTGIYTDTIANAVGCDSIITINLTILNSTSFSRNITACESYSSINGVFVYTASGTYMETIPNSLGCDSVVTTILTIVQPTDATVILSACGSFNAPSGATTWTISGTYTDVIPNAVGCDSNITYVLTIISPSAFTQSMTICKGESVVVGTNTHITSGIYIDTLVNAIGCDSTVTTNLTVDEVDVTITQAGVTLTADNSNGTYQWINCDSSNAPIAGETGQIFTASENGSYAVVITEGACTDTSECMSVTQVGIIDITNSVVINVYPNPAGADHNTVTIAVENVNDYSLIIRDLTGKMVFLKSGVNTHSNTIDISNFAAGTFIIEIKTDNYRSFSKLIVM